MSPAPVARRMVAPRARNARRLDHRSGRPPAAQASTSDLPWSPSPRRLRPASPAAAPGSPPPARPACSGRRGRPVPDRPDATHPRRRGRPRGSTPASSSACCWCGGLLLITRVTESGSGQSLAGLSWSQVSPCSSRRSWSPSGRPRARDPGLDRHDRGAHPGSRRRPTSTPWAYTWALVARRAGRRHLLRRREGRRRAYAQRAAIDARRPGAVLRVRAVLRGRDRALGRADRASTTCCPTPSASACSSSVVVAGTVATSARARAR